MLKNGDKITIKFADKIVLDMDASELTGEYLFGADTDRDILTAPCLVGLASVSDDRLVFSPVSDSQTFYNKVQLGGRTSGFWEIRSMVDKSCLASGLVIFEPGVIVPGLTPSPDPSLPYATVQYVDDQIEELRTDITPALEAIKSDTAQLITDVAAVETKVDDMLDHVNVKFGVTDSKIDSVKSVADATKTALDAAKIVIDATKTKVDSFDAKWTAIETSVNNWLSSPVGV